MKKRLKFSMIDKFEKLDQLSKNQLNGIKGGQIIKPITPAVTPTFSFTNKPSHQPIISFNPISVTGTINF